MSSGAATCLGALNLAEACLLDGRRTTTHWNRARGLARFQKVKVDEDRILIIECPRRRQMWDALSR